MPQGSLPNYADGTVAVEFMFGDHPLVAFEPTKLKLADAEFTMVIEVLKEKRKKKNG